MSSEFKKKTLTLCFAHDDSNVLLGMKKRGFGAGRWNGFGGKLQEGESVEDAARREFNEETGLMSKNISKKGSLTFIYNHDQLIMEVHVFSVLDYVGELRETEEMLPKWFSRDEIPFADMWPSDEYWFHLFLDGKKFEGEFIFSDYDTIIKHLVREII